MILFKKHPCICMCVLYALVKAFSVSATVVELSIDSITVDSKWVTLLVLIKLEKYDAVESITGAGEIRPLFIAIHSLP